MRKELSKNIVLYALLASIGLTGCGEKSDCEVPTSHVHLYTKDITDEITIEKYVNDEHLKYHGYDWHSEYIEITRDDEQIYRLLESKRLFNGVDNWDYAFHFMSSKRDFLEFYYHYITTEVYTTTDGKGNTQTHTRTVTHEGWHADPTDSDNTGKVRLNHHRFYGYCIVYSDGKYSLQKSDLVDDIRDVINDYPYVSEDFSEIVSKEFEFDKNRLPYLKVEDFDTFTGPDLSNTDINPAKRISLN